ncbi:glycosyltransferase family 2 protein [Hyphomicrobium sp. 2TAF46]|uniref:glycosyltransferase family 2 protein n=1 Tax=Hyphomicrobium sp. 2TAF46 TaxID=3233019 RepID=UPI003F8E6B52
MAEITALILTYNQERTIEAAMRSAIAQSEHQDIEILVSDDASPDSTFETAKAVAARSPSIPIEVRRNPANLGTMRHYRHVISTITTPYLAILEGDDVWTSPTKLVRQIDCLKRMSHAAFCFTACEVTEDQLSRLHPALAHTRRYWNLGVVDLLFENSPSTFSNCMYRTGQLQSVLDRVQHVRGFDWIVNLILASKGPVIFDPTPSTRYVLHAEGQWSRLSAHQRKSMIGDTLSAFDEITDFAYQPFVIEAQRKFGMGNA